MWKTTYCSSTTYGSFLLTTVFSTIVCGMMLMWVLSGVPLHLVFCFATPPLFFYTKYILNFLVTTPFCSKGVFGLVKIFL